MESTVNTRVLLLKTHLNLNNLEFCTKVNISIGTMSSIQNGGNISPKLIRSICQTLNINKEWLIHDKGKMFNEAPKNTIGLTVKNPWEDEAYVNLKSENTGLKKEVERLWQMVSHYTSGATPNFLKAFNFPTTLLNQQLAK